MNSEKFKNRWRTHQSVLDKKPSYLKYDDIFMSGNSGTNRNRPNVNNQNQDELYETAEYTPADNDFGYDENDEREYFGRDRGSISEEKMIRYQKRQLPPLQRYGGTQTHSRRHWPHDGRDYQCDSYWDHDDSPKRNSYYNNGSIFGAIWQKFVIAFTSILSLVCLTWVAYNWGNKNENKPLSSSEPVVIEPEQSAFRVLPDNPGGVNIPHRDKMIYEEMNSSRHSESAERDESLLPPWETPVVNSGAQNDSSIDEYSIVDDRTYYIKVASSKNKNVLRSQINSVKSRLAGSLDTVKCSIKSVKNKRGSVEQALLVGPFETKEEAVKMASELNADCSVVAVRE